MQLFSTEILGPLVRNCDITYFKKQYILIYDIVHNYVVYVSGSHEITVHLYEPTDFHLLCS